MTQQECAHLLEVEGGKPAQHKVELVDQHKTILKLREPLPERRRGQRSFLKRVVIKVEQDELQDEADGQHDPGMGGTAAQEEQEQREDDIKLQREQDVIELVRRITCEDVDERGGDKGFRRLVRHIDPDVDHAPDGVGQQNADAAFLPELFERKRPAIIDVDQGEGGDKDENLPGEMQRMHRLVEDLLVLTRLDEGKIVLRHDTIQVEPIIATICNQAGYLARGQEISCDIASNLPSIQADRDRLQQVLLNIVDNALKFTPASGRVDITAESDGQGAVLMRVRDSGQGIAAEALPHVFDRLYRADPARSRQPRQVGGSGLGLAIARELLEAQGATIAITSIPGEGTTVTIRFPATQEIQAYAGTKK